MTMAPSFSDITYFIEVARTENISRAAERLGIAQPSLSSAIKRLEDSVGTTLLIRGRTGVKLTKPGKELLGRGRQLLLSWEQLRADINRRVTDVSGEYVIGCHSSVALYTLSNFLPELVQKHPALNLKLIHDLSRKITEEVISFEIDIGIVVNPVSHPDLVIKELCKDEVRFWCAAAPSSTQVLDPNKGVLICDLSLAQTQKLLGELKKKNMGFKRVIQSSNLEVITDLTSSGVGIGILPNRVATRLPSHRLKPLSGQLPVFKDRICLIYRADSQKTKGSEIILDAIRKTLIS
jgi:LysR family transcriptional regulator, cell division regulator